MRDYTPDELLRGRFLRHFMGLDNQVDQADEVGFEAEGVERTPLPKTRETERPQRLHPTSH